MQNQLCFVMAKNLVTESLLYVTIGVAHLHIGQLETKSIENLNFILKGAIFHQICIKRFKPDTFAANIHGKAFRKYT